MTETVEATLIVELNISCPNCDEYINLIEHENMNDDGAMISQVFSNENLTDGHEKFREEINCPQCHQEIQIKGIYW